MNKAAIDGYTECFKVTSRGLYAISRSRYYRPEQVQLLDTCRIEAQGTPMDNTTMYMIETSDGLKGTLVETFGAQAEGSISKFISEVEDIRRKIARHDQHEC